MSMKIRIFLLVLGFAGILSLPASAQIFAETGKINLEAAPGQAISDSMMVHNTSNQGVKVKAYWEDFTYQPPFDGTKKFLPAGSAKDSMSSWVSFSPQEFTLAPFAKQAIAYVIKVPEDFKGGHYGVMFFERQDDNQPMVDEATGVRIVTRVGSLFFLVPENKDKSAAIENLNLSGGQLTGDLQNQGDVILIPSATFYVLDPEGMVVDRGEVQSLYLPPGEKGNFTVQLKDDLPAGQYTVVFTFDLQDGDVLVKEVDFEKSSLKSSILKMRD